MRPKTLPLLLAAAAFAQPSPATYSWQTGTGNWSTTDSSWYVDSGSTLTPWTDGNDAVFAGTGGTVTNTEAITFNSFPVTSGTWTFDGSTNSGDFDFGGSGGLTINGGNVTMVNLYTTFTG